MVGLNDLGEEADDAGGGVKLAAFASLVAGEFTEEVFVDVSEGVVVHGGRDFGHLLQQFLQKGAGEEVVGFGKDASEL